MAKETVKAGQTSDLTIIKAGEQLVGLDRLDSCIRLINSGLNSVRQCFFNIGKQLSEVKEENLFRFVGFESVYEFADMTFGFKSTLTKNLISVYESFRDKDGCMLDDFNEVPSSRLIELLPLKDDKDLCKDLKDLPVASIKNVKRVLDVSKDYSSVMSDLIRRVTPGIEKALNDSRIGEHKTVLSVPDDVFSYEGFALEISNKSIKGLRIVFNTRYTGKFRVDLEKKNWSYSFSQDVFYLTDNLEDSLFSPLLKTLKSAVKSEAKDARKKKEESDKRKAEKKAARAPFVHPSGDGIKAYLSDDSSWEYDCWLSHGDNIRIAYLKHCPHIRRFCFYGDDGKVINLLYFDFLPSKFSKGTVGPFDKDEVAGLITDDRWEK